MNQFEDKGQTCRVCKQKRNWDLNAYNSGRRLCKSCDEKKPRKRHNGKGVGAAERSRQWRRNNVASAIVTDSRKSDRKKGRKNDLSVGRVEEVIAGGCSYCGEQEIRMTLDRKDNARGHELDNVVAACVRCNYLRRDMPYEAWMAVVPAIRAAKERGLFGSWTGSFPFLKKNNVTVA